MLTFLVIVRPVRSMNGCLVFLGCFYSDLTRKRLSSAESA